MQPLKLTVRGFTSLKTEQVLDFTQLDSLFVITGPHGAGKSSILDAIAFALFGKVARDLNPKDLLSQGRDRLAVCFEFELGGERYRVTRDYDYKTKSGKVFVALETLDAAQKWRSMGFDTIKAVNQKISDLLGIDPETFFKIVLLPQGEFAAFLKGTAGDRKAILEKLFPEFGIFKRMAELAAERTSTLSAQREWVASQLARLAAPTETQLAELTAACDRATAERTAAETERDRLALELAAARELAQKAAELARLRAEGGRLRARAPDIQQQRATLAAARQALALEAEWRQTETARSQQTEATTHHEVTDRTWVTSQQALASQQASLDTLHAQGETLKVREAALKAAAGPAQARDRATAEWQQAQAAWQERQTARDSAREACDLALERVETLATERQATHAELERYAPGGGERLATLESVARLLLPQWEALQAELVATAANLARSRATLEACDLAWEAARQAVAAARQDLETATAACEVARDREAAAFLRAKLQAGDPCPVCNGTFSGGGPEQLLLSELPVLSARQQACSDRLEAARQQASRAEIALAQARERHHQAQLGDTRLQAQLGDLQAKIASQLDVSSWNAGAIAAECECLQAREEAYQQALAAHTTAERAWQEARTHWQLQQQQLATATREFDRAETLLKDKLTARDRAVTELIAALADLRRDLGDLSFTRLQETLTAARQTFDRQWELARSSYERERDTCLRAEADARAARQALETATARVATCEATWKSTLARFSWHEADFLAARLPYDRSQELAAAIETYDSQWADLTRQIDALAAEIGDREPVALEALQERCQACQKTCSELAHRERDLSLQLERGQRDRTEAANLAAQKHDLDGQLDRAETLKKELSGRNFQRYLQDALQGDLLVSASQKLTQLSDRYSLTTDGSGNYLVEDRWNGGERRKVASLSGGETFMASLAMALALGNLLAGNNQIGSLFLDEGFGSLDSEAIETAISTLENLRRSDRLVGIITHVKAVAERIPSQIQVVKSEQGSTATII